MKSQSDWTRLPGVGGKCGATFLHKSGWRVRHCGHPTAIWPYYGIPPNSTDASDRCTILLTGGFGLGTGFTTLKEAQAAVLACIGRNKLEDL